MLEGLKRFYHKVFGTNAPTPPGDVPIPALENALFSAPSRACALAAIAYPEQMRGPLLETIDHSLDLLESGLPIGSPHDRPTEGDPGNDQPRRDLRSVLKSLSSNFKVTADLLAGNAFLCSAISANDLGESLIRLAALMYEAREFFLEQHAESDGDPSDEATQSLLDLRERLASKIRSARAELISYRSEWVPEPPAKGGPE